MYRRFSKKIWWAMAPPSPPRSVLDVRVTTNHDLRRYLWVCIRGKPNSVLADHNIGANSISTTAANSISTTTCLPWILRKNRLCNWIKDEYWMNDYLFPFIKKDIFNSIDDRVVQSFWSMKICRKQLLKFSPKVDKWLIKIKK